MFLMHDRIIALTIILPDKRVLLRRARYNTEVSPWTITREFIHTSTGSVRAEILGILATFYGTPAFDPEKGSLLALNPFQMSSKSVHGFAFHAKSPFSFSCTRREEYKAVHADRLLEDILLHTARKPDGEGMHSWVSMHMAADLDRQGHFDL
jgi:hypothetical protein